MTEPPPAPPPMPEAGWTATRAPALPGVVVPPPTHEPPGWSVAGPAWPPPGSPARPFHLTKAGWSEPVPLARRALVRELVLCMGIALALPVLQILLLLGTDTEQVPTSEPLFVVLNALILFVIACLPAFFVGLIARRHGGLRAIGVRRDRVWMSIGVGLAGWFIVLVVLGLTLSSVENDETIDSADLGLGAATPGWVVVTFAFLLSASAALSEELMFRGYLLSRLDRLGVAPLGALAIATALFGALHWTQGIVGVVATGAIGLGCAIAYLLTRNLVAAIVLHFVWNFVQVLVIFYVQ